MHQYLSVFKSLQFAHPSKLFAGFKGENEQREASLKHSFTIQKISRLGSDFVAIVQRTGDVDDCTFSSSSFHGLNKQDIQDSGFMRLVHVADRPATLGAFSQAIHTGEQVRVELRLRCHPHEDSANFFCWIELICSALDSMDEAVDGEGQVLCLARDISSWKNREAELIAREQLTREQIETRTRLLVNMSHELRTPLNTIIGFSEMMKLPGVTAQSEQQMVEYAGIIFDSGQDLLGVVNEVLDMSQFDAGQYKVDPQIFSVSDLVSAGVELVQLEATAKDVSFLISGHEDDLQMNADWAACRQALVGLLAAQVKGAPGGRVHLKVGAEEDFVVFVVTASTQEGSTELLEFHVGLQMKNFIDLVSGKLEISLDKPGKNEVVLKLPQNLCLDKKDSNIVSIGAELAEPVLDLKKTA